MYKHLSSHSLFHRWTHLTKTDCLEWTYLNPFDKNWTKSYPKRKINMDPKKKSKSYSQNLRRWAWMDNNMIDGHRRWALRAERRLSTEGSTKWLSYRQTGWDAGDDETVEWRWRCEQGEMQLCFFIVIANGLVFFQGWEGKIMTGSIPNDLVGIINPTEKFWVERLFIRYILVKFCPQTWDYNKVKNGDCTNKYNIGYNTEQGQLDTALHLVLNPRVVYQPTT